MRLSDEDIKKFREIYKEYFGKEINREKAVEDGYALVRLMQLIYKPVLKSDFEKYRSKEKVKI